MAFFCLISYSSRCTCKTLWTFYFLFFFVQYSAKEGVLTTGVAQRGNFQNSRIINRVKQTHANMWCGRRYSGVIYKANSCMFALPLRHKTMGVSLSEMLKMSDKTNRWFKVNKQLPTRAYGFLQPRTETGLHEMLILSSREMFPAQLFTTLAYTSKYKNES